MRCIHFTYLQGTREIRIVQLNKLYYIEDNESKEYDNVTFMTYQSAKNILEIEEKHNDVEAQV